MQPSECKPTDTLALLTEEEYKQIVAQREAKERITLSGQIKHHLNLSPDVYDYKLDIRMNRVSVDLFFRKLSVQTLRELARLVAMQG